MALSVINIFDILCYYLLDWHTKTSFATDLIIIEFSFIFGLNIK